MVCQLQSWNFLFTNVLLRMEKMQFYTALSSSEKHKWNAWLNEPHMTSMCILNRHKPQYWPNVNTCQMHKYSWNKTGVKKIVLGMKLNGTLMCSWGNLSHSVTSTKKSEICQTNPFRLAESLKFTPEHCSLICNTLNKDYNKPHAGFLLRQIYALS